MPCLPCYIFPKKRALGGLIHPVSCDLQMQRLPHMHWNTDWCYFFLYYILDTIISSCTWYILVYIMYHWKLLSIAYIFSRYNTSVSKPVVYRAKITALVFRTKCTDNSSFNIEKKNMNYNIILCKRSSLLIHIDNLRLFDYENDFLGNIWKLRRKKVISEVKLSIWIVK